MSFPGGPHSWGQAPEDVQAKEAPQQPNLFFLSECKMLTRSNAALLTYFSHWVCCMDRACSSDSGKGKQRSGTVPLESPLAPFPSQNGSSLTLLGYQPSPLAHFPLTSKLMVFSQQQTTLTKWVRGTTGPPEQPLWLQITGSEGKGLFCP